MTEYSALSHTGFLNNKSKSITVSLVQSNWCLPKSIRAFESPLIRENSKKSRQHRPGNLRQSKLCYHLCFEFIDRWETPATEEGGIANCSGKWLGPPLTLRIKDGQRRGEEDSVRGCDGRGKKSVITGGNEGICLLPGFFVASWQTHIGWKKVYKYTPNTC